MDHDVVVIGAGAAGLMAATVAARRGRRVLLLEKNRRPGLKILISGGGRCNLTTTREGADLEAQYGPRRGRWLRHALRSFGPGDLRRHVETLGVRLQEEDLEKVFPVSGRAAEVVDALCADALAAGVQIRHEVSMRALRPVPAGGGCLAVESSAGSFVAASVVLATGGLSYPKTGATGDGYPVAQALGHSLVRPVPALAPLSVEEDWLHELQGLVLDARLTLRGPSGAVLVQRRRPTLITHRGLSGPGPMDVSGFVEEVGGGCVLELDLLPDLRREDLERALLEGARAQGRRRVHHLLPGQVPERLRIALCRRAGVEDRLAAELSKVGRRQLVELLKALPIPVDRSLGFKAAEITRGGIPLEEVDSRTMRSRCHPSLFVCGEILDVDGPIGGFNFQAAFATGRLAGLEA
jgi:predicted Rossmann fold flavoprotein